jgi:hypothetical protein
VHHKLGVRRKEGRKEGRKGGREGGREGNCHSKVTSAVFPLTHHIQKVPGSFIP